MFQLKNCIKGTTQYHRIFSILCPPISQWLNSEILRLHDPDTGGIGKRFFQRIESKTEKNLEKVKRRQDSTGINKTISP